MNIIPAIDVSNKKCVRLKKGNFNEETIYSDDPVSIANLWFESGAEYLHLVDLDGALKGKSVNQDIFIEIAESFSDKHIQVGGGIRNLDIAQNYLDKGISRVIIGTKAIEDSGFIRDLCDSYPNRIILGVDSENGYIKTQGWKKETSVKTLDLVRRYTNYPLAAIIFTDISRDGMMRGPNIDATLGIARNTKIPVIASGGISNIDEIKDLSESGLIYGAIIGKALYEKNFTLEEAIKSSE
tara:strand:- start:164 stop:883 length:720 start_codon:yes stop_codon:yes gene_type:complete